VSSNNHTQSLTRGFLLLVGFVVAVGMSGACLSVQADESVSRTLENRIKSGFLFNFAKYVDWPEGTFSSPTNAILIGVLGVDPFGKVLDETVSGKRIDGRPILLRRFQDVTEIKQCHVLFISASEKYRLALIRTYLKQRAILTVGDFKGFLEAGGQIGFVTENNRVKFDINRDAVRAAGLRLDANLLRVARRVLPPEDKASADDNETVP